MALARDPLQRRADAIYEADKAADERQDREHTTTLAMEHALGMYAKDRTFGSPDPTAPMLVGVLGTSSEAEWFRGIALAAKVRFDARRRTIELRNEAQ